MSDPQPESDAAKIRAKRMAKLAGAGASSPATASAAPATSQANGAEEASNSTPETASAQVPPQQSTESPKAASASSPNPFSQLGLKPEQQEQTPARTQIKVTPLKREADAPTQPKSRQGRQETPEDWEDRTLGAIFRVTLKEDQTSDNQGRLQFLPGLKSDLEEGGNGSPARLTVGTLDTAILEAASTLQTGKPLDYLLSCWKRVVRLGRNLRSPATEPWKADIGKEARRLCMSYCLFAVSDPEMFGIEGSGQELLADRMVDNPDGESGTCFDFFQEAANRVQEDEGARDVLVGAMVECSRRLSRISMDGDYRSYMMVRYIDHSGDIRLTNPGVAKFYSTSTTV